MRRDLEVEHFLELLGLVEVEDLGVAVECLFHEVDGELGHLRQELASLGPRGHRKGKEVWKRRERMEYTMEGWEEYAIK